MTGNYYTNDMTIRKAEWVKQYGIDNLHTAIEVFAYDRPQLESSSYHIAKKRSTGTSRA